ncbi:GreA/GreB family elongation factor [Maribacter algicola]|uniref:GreA/GreB family elongation factor n=1 Tax=Maribacter algicola TaxID=2498892 RepID=UPI001FB45E04|nr:GreA/GreB family elongation factor [Maribacter algicola]
MKKKLEIKKVAYQHCLDFVSGRLSRLKKQIQEVQESLTSETKSTAGDKHETGRAMVQLEREKLGTQLAETEKMQLVMNRVKPGSQNRLAGMGALIETNGPYYYIAISSGEVKFENNAIYCISPATPIGKLLLGKSAGEIISFNGKDFSLLSIS